MLVIEAAPDEPSDSPSTPRCVACRARLAHDQRYCVECGTRRGPLPAAVAELLKATAPTETREAPLPAAVPVPIGALRDLDDTPGGPARDWVDRLSALSPRAASVAVMGMLAFGAVVGSSVGSVAQSATGAPVDVAVTLPRSPASPASSDSTATPASSSGGGAGGGGGGGSGGGGSVTVTVPAQTAQTVIAPASSTNPSGGGGSTTPSSVPASTLPPVKHVFMIVLSNVGYKQSFGARSGDPYLARTLAQQGEVLPYYYAVTQSSLANSIAMISGQGPTEQTAVDCPIFADIVPGKLVKQGEVQGSGCVYPLRTSTLADQLTDNGETWKAYVEGVDGGPAGQPKSCRHPETLGAGDPDQAPRPGDPYVTWRNPFVYFHSLIDPTTCATDDVGLPALKTDLKSERTTPSVVWIFPGPCDDGDPQPCATDKPAGMGPADAFLKRVVPEIERSAAYKADGLIAITADQAPQTGPDADPSACCGNPTYPNLSLSPTAPGATTTTPTTGTATTPTTTTTTTTTAGATTTPTTTAGATTTPTTTAGATTTTPTPGRTTPTSTGTTPTTSTLTPTASTPTTGSTPTSTTPTTTTTSTSTTTTTTTPTSSGAQTTPTGGGGRVGLLLISRYVKPGTTDTLDYFNHFALLGSIEDLFGLEHLGYAADPALPLFYGGVYNAYTSGG
jgi:hypothetical protein